MLSAAAALAAPFVGCSGDDDALPRLHGSGGNGASDGGSVQCEDGATRVCAITISEHEGILTCYKGSQRCAGGAWGACMDGALEYRRGSGEERAAGAPTSAPQALGPPSACLNNPCDPYCQNYDEQPEGGAQPEGGNPIFTWPGGTLTGFPTGLVTKGLTEPCSTGSDCQFNHYCQNPRTSTTCSHSKCQTGRGLRPSCEPCVAEVCTASPSCCRPDFNTSCSHDPCQVGDKLGNNCDPCVQTVCAADSTCCSGTGSWHQGCVDKVTTLCGKACFCDPGELAGPNRQRCYFFEKTTPQTWAAARTACQARGTGWDLASIGTAQENDFIRGNIGSDETWHGFTDAASEGNWVWANGDAVGYTNWNAGEPNEGTAANCARVMMGGGWTDRDCGLAFRSVCEGPTNFDGLWTQACVDLVESTCDVACGSPTTSTCAHDVCVTGGPLAASCNACAEKICQVQPSCCSGTWDNSCINLVGTQCAASCPMSTENPPPETAQCVPWLPTQKDPKCGGVDLALGPTCGVGASASVPVCNHGNTTAQPPIRIIHFPANASQYPKCTPNQGHPQMETCTLNQPVPPGECVSLVGCTGLSGNREIMVNPPGAAQIAECSCRDNWSLYNGGTCDPPACFQGEINRAGTCSVNLTNVSNIDETDVSVVQLPAMIGLSKVASSGACGATGGWYFDNNTTPTRVLLCPASCTQLNATTDGYVSVNIGCAKVLSTTTITQVYEGTCAPDSGPVWMLFAWDTVTPLDSNVVFRARTGLSADDLANHSLVTLGTARITPDDTQVCPLVNGPSGCPVDLFLALGGPPAVERAFLELQVTMNPATNTIDGPTVNGWEIRYSCRPNQ